MKAIGTIEKPTHIEGCEAVNKATRGRGTAAQRSPWFHNRTIWGSRAGISRGGSFRWLEFRCLGNGCDAILLLRSDFLLARAGFGTFSA